MKKLIARYFSPTPVKWRKFGDTLLLISATATNYAIANDDKTIAYIVLVLGVLGKLISNLAVDSPVPATDQTTAQ